MKGSIDVDVDLPPAEAFERLSSPRDLLAGVGEVAGLRRASGRGGVGTTYEATVAAGGRREAVTAEVLEHDEPRRVAYELRGKPGTATVDVRLAPRKAGKATRLTCAYDVALSGMARFVAGPLLSAWLRRHEDDVRERVRDALEAPAKKAPRRR